VAVILLTFRLASVPGAHDFLRFRRWDLASPAIQVVSITSSFCFWLHLELRKSRNLLGKAI
jgi:hypothetical protein